MLHNPIHNSLTLDVLMEATKRQMFGLDDPGFCTNCGQEHGGCEPDARDYPCESCGESSVYGAGDLFMMIV